MDKPLAIWLKYKQQLDAFKKLEHEARVAVIEEVFKPAGLVKTEGTSHLSQDRYDFVATFRMNYRVTNEDKLNKFLASLPEWQRPMVIAYKPTVQLLGYRKLDAKQLKAINKALEIKSGTPGLEYKSP